MNTKIHLVIISVVSFLVPDLLNATMLAYSEQTHEGTAFFKQEFVLNLDEAPVSVGAGKFLARYSNKINLTVNKSKYECYALALLELNSSKANKKIASLSDVRDLKISSIEKGIELTLSNERMLSINCVARGRTESTADIMKALESTINLIVISLRSLNSDKPNPVNQPVPESKIKKNRVAS